MPGDNGNEGTVSSCEIIYATNGYFAGSVTAAVPESGLSRGGKNHTLAGLSVYSRYWVKIKASDEAGNASSSTVVSCYTGTSFLNTPSFSGSVNVSTAPSLAIAFKIELDTVTSGAPVNSIEIWDTRDNLGLVYSSKISSGQYTVTVSSDAKGMTVSPHLANNHRYALVISSAILDIDGKLMISKTSFYFVTLCSPSEDNIFFASDGSSVTVESGQFPSPASLAFIANPRADPDIEAAYNAIGGTYSIVAVKGFTVSPGTVTAVIPVSGGIPYVYNRETKVFEKASSYVSNDGEVVFNAESPAVWLFVTKDSFSAKKAAGVYAYPVPATGNSVTFTNLGSSAEISVFTISGKSVMRENVTPDPVNGEWVWNFDRIAPGLYFWVVDGASKGMLMIKR